MGLRLRSTPNTKFLSEYLAKNFIVEQKKTGRTFNRQDIIAIAHAAIFLGCKIRERDIHCPMVTHILNAGEHIVEEKDLRKMELELSTFYDWNLAMMTYYDLLEQFMHMGLTFATDKIRLSQKNSSKRRKAETADQSGKRKNSGDISTQRGTPEDQRKSNDCRIVRIGDLETEEKDKILDKLERRCLDLAKQIFEKFHTDPTKQREVAYMIIRTARREAGFVDYDSDMLREFYKMEISDEKELRKSSKKLTLDCKPQRLKFDLVVRMYDPDGQEMIPPPVLELLQAEGEKIRAALEKKFGGQNQQMNHQGQNEHRQQNHNNFPPQRVSANGGQQNHNGQRNSNPGIHNNQANIQRHGPYNKQARNTYQISKTNTLTFHSKQTKKVWPGSKPQGKIFEKTKIIKVSSSKKTFKKMNKTTQGFFKNSSKPKLKNARATKPAVSRPQTQKISNRKNLFKSKQMRPSYSFNKLQIARSYTNQKNTVQIHGRPATLNGNRNAFMNIANKFSKKVRNLFLLKKQLGYDRRSRSSRVQEELSEGCGRKEGNQMFLSFVNEERSARNNFTKEEEINRRNALDRHSRKDLTGFDYFSGEPMRLDLNPEFSLSKPRKRTRRREGYGSGRNPLKRRVFSKEKKCQKISNFSLCKTRKYLKNPVRLKPKKCRIVSSGGKESEFFLRSVSPLNQRPFSKGK